MSEYDFLKIFESIIDEADVSGQESEKQDDVASGLSHHKASKSNKKKDTIKDKRNEKNVEVDLEEDLEEDQEEDNQEIDDSQQSSDQIKISTEFTDFIKAANALRATRSFRDKDVKDDLSTYFKSLSTGEKESLYVFFKGLTQIAGSDVDGDKAPAPHKYGIKTSSKTNQTKPESKNKSVEKSEEKSDKSSNPITVGESIQDKSGILNILREINNK